MTDKLRAAAQQVLEKIAKAHTKIDALCLGNERWTMSVPIRPDHDHDLVISGALYAAAEFIRAALAEQPAEQEPDGLPLVVAGAIFDFAGYMTTRSKVIEVGSTAEAGPVADLVKGWAKLRGLSLDDAAVLSWREWLPTAPQPAKSAEQGPVAQRWQPIETAPKGRIVLVYYKNSLGNGRTMRARYYLPETLDSDTTESGWADEGWYEESEAYEYLMPLEHDPTHWMPLPAGPDTTPQPAIPPGYKLVPVEPTREMLEMGQWLEYPESGSRMQPVRMEDVRGVWKAMLAAAPEAPQPAKRVPLTDEEVLRIWSPEPSRPVMGRNKVLTFARAIIAAYDAKNGITGEAK